ncbi:SDR family oxidoreductase [Enterococcus massiliensis]|uniref:SDR family oxidoreductase n=1 Tax=Enterococcus massiliensis TaxID=1640685 RepID=UPI00065E24EF|nr:SDR family oxidoreductase [Enterococcus massiliensis]
MKIFVVGGSGRVAADLITALKEQGHEVIAGARHPEKIVSQEVTAVHLDLHESVEKIAEIIGSVDVIYFVAGSRGNDLLQTDAFGAVKTMQAAEKNGVSRYIMLSSIFSLQPEEWYREGLKQLMDYNIAKFFADNYLITNTSLDYTILQPTGLTTEKGTGKIHIGEGSVSTNPIPDVAKTLAAIIDHPNTSKKIIMMRSGDTPIHDALAQI